MKYEVYYFEENTKRQEGSVVFVYNNTHFHCTCCYESQLNEIIEEYKQHLDSALSMPTGISLWNKAIQNKDLKYLIYPRGKEIINSKPKCTCNLWTGCTCGVFKAEQEAKKKCK